MPVPFLMGGLTSYSAGAPAGGTAGVSSHAGTVHHVHTRAACFANSDNLDVDQQNRLSDGHCVANSFGCECLTTVAFRCGANKRSSMKVLGVRDLHSEPSPSAAIWHGAELVFPHIPI